MFVTRRLSPGRVVLFGLRFISFAAAWALTVYAAFAWLGLTWIRLPFLPIATMGTAVAFYVGFKNNASYDRFWEGRKIWGGIVNSSRTWATNVMAYIEPEDRGPEATAMRRELIYRHLAWINALRLQLRAKSRFFDKPAPQTKRRLENHAEHMRNDWDKEIGPFLGSEEHEAMEAYKHPATQILRKQGETIAALVRVDRIAMMEVVEELYTLQGKCERIKNTPFPRQYAEYSRIFTRVFVFFVPFGMLDVFADEVASSPSRLQSLAFAGAMVLASALVAWVFRTMETIGDASEDPFERSMNDVPMNALCRTIEIDLRQMLGETELPEGEQPIDGILY